MHAPNAVRKDRSHLLSGALALAVAPFASGSRANISVGVVVAG